VGQLNGHFVSCGVGVPPSPLITQMKENKGFLIKIYRVNALFSII